MEKSGKISRAVQIRELTDDMVTEREMYIVQDLLLPFCAFYTQTAGKGQQI